MLHRAHSIEYMETAVGWYICAVKVQLCDFVIVEAQAGGRLVQLAVSKI